MVQPIRTCVAVFAFWVSVLPPALSQQIALSGRVIDVSSQPIEGVAVELIQAGLTTRTDAQGRYTFSANPPVHVRIQHAIAPISGSTIVLDAATQSVTMETVDLRGRVVGSVTHTSEEPPLTPSLAAKGPSAAGTYLVKITAGNACYTVRRTVLDGHRGMPVVRISAPAFAPAKSLASGIDSLHCWKSGYENAVSEVPNLTSTHTDIILRTGIAFEPFFRGSGRIPNLSTGDSVRLRAPEMIHLMVLPEGYTQEDLVAGRYDRDLATWFQDVFTLDAMAFLKEAFIVWRHPVASREHLVTEGTVDSYFRLPLAGGAMASTGYDTAAARTWRLIGKFPFAPRTFATPINAKNLVCSYMLYDTRNQRSGFSGMSTSWANPANAAQRVGVAMALGHQHEFMHAMVRLSDEYYDRAQTPLGDNTLRPESRYVSNVASRNTCDTLPWKHLLYGREYNKSTDSLVGAFGANGRYHPELKCLLNGSHDNTDIFGGNSNLRTNTRMCNWCRELCVFRIYERCLVLPDQATSYQQWMAGYRRPFYQVLKFSIPTVVPQQNSEGLKWFMPCR